MNDLHGHTKKSPLKAIRQNCLDCVGYKPSDVRNCHITDCSLWPFRMGNNPFHKRKMTDTAKKVATERLPAKNKKRK